MSLISKIKVHAVLLFTTALVSSGGWAAEAPKPNQKPIEAIRGALERMKKTRDELRTAVKAKAMSRADADRVLKVLTDAKAEAHTALWTLEPHPHAITFGEMERAIESLKRAVVAVPHQASPKTEELAAEVQSAYEAVANKVGDLKRKARDQRMSDKDNAVNAALKESGYRKYLLTVMRFLDAAFYGLWREALNTVQDVHGIGREAVHFGREEWRRLSALRKLQLAMNHQGLDAQSLRAKVDKAEGGSGDLAPASLGIDISSGQPLLVLGRSRGEGGIENRVYRVVTRSDAEPRVEPVSDQFVGSLVTLNGAKSDVRSGQAADLRARAGGDFSGESQLTSAELRGVAQRHADWMLTQAHEQAHDEATGI